MFRIENPIGRLLLVCLLANTGCQGEDQKNDEVLALVLSQQLVAPATEMPDLPQPTLDTVLLIVDGNQETLAEKRDCSDGPDGIAFDKLAAPPFVPVFNLHQVDFLQNTGVFLEAGVPVTGIQMDVDYSDGKTYGVTQNCAVKVIENSATIYDIQAQNCSVADSNGNGQTQRVLSFRVRCTKN
ncbi:hypothetical protein EHQ12_14280 [Leptospira gomenensis]|uniref:Uncharacterized protein n=1 Tax=Leptospira gomenensis TaxID=2484974 RepID=A0A5F1YAG0_9LEPT|nr:hypothetical protein [Leptospira gomenensis]TGK33846.1 hypothetical protein EHQ17_10085 [Leptospira gomenensis]TGK36300.1 hypothetical protein EHQ12_14280 [Leptospira gomenensis]TGK52071.1 hypothetical protein EHQ07_00380 [Leptospira gomenensis]TGK59880.1 hypothetical protein EHQ13_11675 [Leptospira gomenensis]